MVSVVIQMKIPILYILYINQLRANHHALCSGEWYQTKYLL